MGPGMRQPQGRPGPGRQTDIIVAMRTLIVLLMLAASPAILLAQKKPIVPEGAKVAGPYTPGIQAGNFLFVAGQVGRDKDGKYPESFEDEVKQTLENVKAVLDKAGYTFADAVSVQVHLTDIALFDRMNKVYLTYFPEPRPARTTVGGAQLVGPARVEITVTCWKK
jgi:reactive intermediate/imine deaminase